MQRTKGCRELWVKFHGLSERAACRGRKFGANGIGNIIKLCLDKIKIESKFEFKLESKFEFKLESIFENKLD